MFPSSLIRSSVRTVDGRVLDGWARSRTPDGLLYYLNHNYGITQWDHPEYIRIMDELLPINSVKYAAYRMACKLRLLQTRFKIHEVSLQCVASAFDCAGFKAAENADIVPAKEIERAVMYMYRTTFKRKPVDSSLFTDLMMNVIQNAYDENRSGNLQVFKCKVLLVAMCGGRLQEKYRYLFNQIADHNNCVTRRRLAKLLQHLAAISELLSEQLSFGINFVPAAVDSCFKEIQSDIGITEDVFLTWLLQEPQPLVWWTTLYRLSSAELVCHDIKCNACKQRPIVGLRYQCLKCLGYNLCQDCFLHGRKSKNHKPSHPLQEYCHESTMKEWRKTIMKIFRYKLTKSGDLKPRYLTISSDSNRSISSLLQETEGGLCSERSAQRLDGGARLEGDESSSYGDELMSRTICASLDDLDNLDCESFEGQPSSSATDCGSHSGMEPIFLPTTPRKQIHSVIKHLEDGQSRLLNNHMEDGTKTTSLPPQVVEQHAAEIQSQILKLRAILKNCLWSQQKNSNVARILPRMESTPIVGDRGMELNLSPITTGSVSTDDALLENKENHLVENQFADSTPKSGALVMNYSFVRSQGSLASSEYRSRNTNAKGSKETTSSFRIGGKLPSFTEINFSDLTMSTRENDSSSGDDSKPKTKEGDVSATTKRLELSVDEDMIEVKEELEKILLHLETIFPNVGNVNEKQGVDGPVAAAQEFADGLCNYADKAASNFSSFNDTPVAQQQ